MEWSALLYPYTFQHLRPYQEGGIRLYCGKLNWLWNSELSFPPYTGRRMNNFFSFSLIVLCPLAVLFSSIQNKQRIIRVSPSEAVVFPCPPVPNFEASDVLRLSSMRETMEDSG